MPISSALARIKSSFIPGSVLDKPYLHYPAKSNSFSVKFSPLHLFTYTTTLCLQEASPLYKFHLKRWHTRQEPLWVSVISSTDVGKKKVVKTTVEKRLRAAYQNSMKKCGYAGDGTKITKIDGNDQDLVGTAQFIAHAPILKTNPRHLQRQMDGAVKEIVFRQKGLAVSTYFTKREKFYGRSW